jgi:hypothetical protein
VACNTHDMVINVSSEPQFFVMMVLVNNLASTKVVLRIVGTMVPASTPTTLDSDANTLLCHTCQLLYDGNKWSVRPELNKRASQSFFGVHRKRHLHARMDNCDVPKTSQ